MSIESANMFITISMMTKRQAAIAALRRINNQPEDVSGDESGSEMVSLKTNYCSLMIDIL
jgi:hypothetical protein